MYIQVLWKKIPKLFGWAASNTRKCMVEQLANCIHSPNLDAPDAKFVNLPDCSVLRTVFLTNRFACS